MTGIGIIGIGGFAKNHIESINHCNKKGLCTLEAAVIRSPDKYEKEIEEIKMDWPDFRVYRSIDELLDNEKSRISMIAVPTGIPSHRYFAVKALDKGYHVLCEKPAAATIEDALAMKSAQEKSGKILTIGFQNIFSPSIQRIKEIAINGSLGKLISLKCTARWKRTSVYYNRNSWAGCIKDGEDFVYDSPIQNATAHYLQNLLYIAGKSHHESALPVKIYGENYHAQNIESADTQYIRCTSEEGVKFSFAVTHATGEVDGPHTEIQFERGRITWSLDDYAGTTKIYDDSDNLIEEFDNRGIDLFKAVFVDTLEAIEEKRQPLSHIGNAYQHTVCINYLFRCSGGIWDMDAQYKEDQAVGDEAYGGYSDNMSESKSDCNTVIRNIDADMTAMFKEGGQSFYDRELPWAKQGKELDVILD